MTFDDGLYHKDIVAMARAAERFALSEDRLSDNSLYGKLADEIERLRAGRDEVVREAKRAFYWHWINELEGDGYSDAARQMRRAAAEEGIKNSGRPEPPPSKEPEPEKASRLTYCRVCDDDVLPGSWLLCSYDACPFVPKEHGISEELG